MMKSGELRHPRDTATPMSANSMHSLQTVSAMHARHAANTMESPHTAHAMLLPHTASAMYTLLKRITRIVM